MKIGYDFGDLLFAASKIGNFSTDFKISIDSTPLEPIEIRLKKGIELTLDKVEFLPNGLAHYQGRQILLYIKDHTMKYREKLLSNPMRYGNRFHIAYCSKLQEMRNRNRFDRYVVTNDISGLFNIFYKDCYGNEVVERVQLSVCKLCLKHLGYRYKGVFNIENFFKHYSTFFPFLPSGISEKSSVYPDNWNTISKEYRTKNSYICESCGVDLSSHKHLLATHHKNGVKSDNREENFKALCLLCHAKEHDHLSVNKQNENMIRTLRIRQHIFGYD